MPPPLPPGPYVEGHARVDRESRTGMTALIAAALADSAEGCKAMIDLHANLNYENRDGDTAVFAAARGGAMAALSALLAGGVRAPFVSSAVARSRLLHSAVLSLSLSELPSINYLLNVNTFDLPLHSPSLRITC